MFQYLEADKQAGIQKCKLVVPTATAAKIGVSRVTTE